MTTQTGNFFDTGSQKLSEKHLLESYQSLERLKYLEEMIRESSKEELGYAVKMMALILASSEEGKMFLGAQKTHPSEADIVYGLVLHASIALENAKKGIDPIRELIDSIRKQEVKASGKKEGKTSD